MRGAGRRLCSIFLRSVWQIPQDSTRISSSPRPISGTGMDSTATWLAPLYTAACMVARAAGAVTRLESAVGKKISKRMGGAAAVAVQLQQTRHRLKGARHGGQRDPGP